MQAVPGIIICIATTGAAAYTFCTAPYCCFFYYNSGPEKGVVPRAQQQLQSLAAAAASSSHRHGRACLSCVTATAA